MYFDKLFSLFTKSKPNKKNSKVGDKQEQLSLAESITDVASQGEVEKTFSEQDDKSIPTQSPIQAVEEKKPDDEEQLEILNAGIHPLQELTDKAYEESGPSFHSELFPNNKRKLSSSRLHPRVIISPSKESDFFELCMNNLAYVNVGDYLKVKQNGIFNSTNGLVIDFEAASKQLEYRHKLKVEAVFEASRTAPAYLKVEVVGYEEILTDYVEVERKNIRTHDGVNLLSVAKDFAQNTSRSKKNFGYDLQLIKNDNTYYVIFYHGSIESAGDINFGVDYQGTDGVVVLGGVEEELISESTRTKMHVIRDYYDREHPNLQYLGWNSPLELIVKNGKIYLYVFDSEKPRSISSEVTSQQESQSTQLKSHDYVRLDNGKYRCSSTNEIFVSSWFFEKKHSIKLSDVNVLQAAQVDGVRHDKKCRIEFESARQIWGEFVYMYPEKWLEQQSPRLW